MELDHAEIEVANKYVSDIDGVETVNTLMTSEAAQSSINLMFGSLPVVAGTHRLAANPNLTRRSN